MAGSLAAPVTSISHTDERNMPKAHRARYRDKIAKAKAYAAAAQDDCHEVHEIEPRPPSSSPESRIDDLRAKRRKAAEFAHELAAMEARARDDHERASLAARRRDVEMQAADFEHRIFRIQAEAAE